MSKTMLSVLFLVVVSFSFAQRKMSPEKYKEWYGKNAGQFKREQAVSKRKYNVIYLTSEAQLLDKIDKNTSKQDKKDLQEEFAQYLDFMFVIEDPENTISSEENTHNMLLFQNEIKMVINHADTVNCTEFQFDQAANIAKRRTYMLSFKRPSAFETIEVVIPTSENKKLSFLYDKPAISNSPKIKW